MFSLWQCPGTYLSLHILCVVLFVDIRFWHLIFDSEPSVSDLDGKTCRKPKLMLVYHSTIAGPQ